MPQRSRAANFHTERAHAFILCMTSSAYNYKRVTRDAVALLCSCVPASMWVYTIGAQMHLHNKVRELYATDGVTTHLHSPYNTKTNQSQTYTDQISVESINKSACIIQWCTTTRDQTIFPRTHAILIFSRMYLIMHAG